MLRRADTVPNEPPFRRFASRQDTHRSSTTEFMVGVLDFSSNQSWIASIIEVSFSDLIRQLKPIQKKARTVNFREINDIILRDPF